MVTPLDPPPAAAGIWLATPEAAGRFDPGRLAPADRDAWTRLRTHRRRLDWASSRALLAALPEAPGSCSSLSHSAGYAAVARAPGSLRVGVDLEWMVPRDFIGMARVAFTAEEVDGLAALDDPAARSARFYEWWTLKEAFAKALGLPLVDALRQCCFAGTAAGGLARVPAEPGWWARVYAPRPQLRLAFVCLRGASTAGRLPPTLTEWPSCASAAWPVVRKLDDTASTGARAC